jgi:hypothetical protein
MQPAREGGKPHAARNGAQLELRRVETSEAAESERFLGSLCEVIVRMRSTSRPRRESPRWAQC